MISRYLRTLPLRAQLRTIMLTITGTALLVASCVWLSWAIITSRRALQSELDALAKVISANSAAAVSFLDQREASRVLDSLESQTHIAAAYTFDAAGEPFAVFLRNQDVTLSEPHDTGNLMSGYLIAEHEIRAGSDTVGSVRLYASTEILRQTAGRSAAVLFAIACGVFAVVVALSAQSARWLAERMQKLAEAAKIVSQHADYSVRVTGEGDRDELGLLVSVFNEMLAGLQERDQQLAGHREQLEEEVHRRTAELSQTNALLEAEIAERTRAESEREKLHQQLVEASREAGMAEVATNVLHNVGNVLNSVNVSCSVLAERVEGSRVAAVAKAAELLLTHESDLPEFIAGDGRKLPSYLHALACHLGEERTELLGEIASVRRNLEHIKEVVVAQQSHARRSGAVERVRVEEVLEQALGLSATLDRDRIVVERDFAELPVITIDRHALLGILANLIRNAKQSINEWAGPRRVLSVRARSLEEIGRRLEIEVQDTGVGIPPENLTRIFSHGFTTKKGGHGFGLHGAALSAKKLGGSLSVFSDGRGEGATFRLELPIEPPEAPTSDRR